MPRFPKITAENLNRRKFTLPDDLEGEVNLLLIPFQQIQQITVNTWIPKLEELSARYPAFRFYELPTISTGYRLARGFIDGGMRAGIAGEATRERTITLYLNKRDFRQKLDLPSEDTIYALLVDRQGEVLWRAEGEFDEAKGQTLEHAVEKQLMPA